MKVVGSWLLGASTIGSWYIGVGMSGNAQAGMLTVAIAFSILSAFLLTATIVSKWDK